MYRRTCAHTNGSKSIRKSRSKIRHDVKIEQQGAMGTIDEITPAEVSAADVVIIAADKVIDGEERFKGKPVVRVKIGQCVANGEAVLSKVVAAIEARKQKEAN